MKLSNLYTEEDTRTEEIQLLTEEDESLKVEINNGKILIIFNTIVDLHVK